MATDILTSFVPAYASKLDSQGERTAVLLYFDEAEVQRIVDAIQENWDALADQSARAATEKSIVRALVKAHTGATSAPDIALFGRMLAEKPVLNLEAACQVAHAISTHRVTMEMDFFTAVDDLNPEDTAGAGMMGFTGFNSACFYRYARIDWRQLVANLGGDQALARRTVEGFLRAAAAAVPSGKQNSFAAYSPPSMLLGVVRRDGMAWSLCNAFEQPVRAHGSEGLVAPSVAALDAHWGRLCRVYGTDEIECTAALAAGAELALDALRGAEVESFEAWLAALLAPLPLGDTEA